MTVETVEYKRTTKNFTKEVVTDGETFTAILTNHINGSTQVCGGWRSYRAALETVQDMYDDACRRRNGSPATRR